jgi:hypothetical protein
MLRFYARLKRLCVAAPLAASVAVKRAMHPTPFFFSQEQKLKFA